MHTGKDGYKSMSYNKLTAVLVEAVKELKSESDAKITAVKTESNSKIALLQAGSNAKDTEIALLKKEVANLKSLNQRMAALEKAMQKNNQNSFQIGLMSSH